MVALSTELADVGKSATSRMAAGLQLKNYLTSKNPEVRLQRQQAWYSLDHELRAYVKNLVSLAWLQQEGSGDDSVWLCLVGAEDTGNRDNTWLSCSGLCDCCCCQMSICRCD